MKIIYQESTQTIRQMPENYLIAYRTELKNGCNRWICEPDLSVNKGLCILVFTLLLDFDNKYGSGENLLNKIQDLPLKERFENWFAGKKNILSLTVNEESFNISGLIFNIYGWGFSDDEAQESDSGIDVEDTIFSNKKIYETFKKLVNTDVTIILKSNVK